MDYAYWKAQVYAAREQIINFGQRVLRAPSLSGEEGQVAALVRAELEDWGYDQVTVDAVGNVIGKIRGGAGPSILFHSHMDIVDAGDPGRWTHPPFDGCLADGFLWGRGACDTKGSLVAQVYALALLKKAGVLLPGDRVLVAAVGEEQGGFGTRYLCRSPLPPIAVVGEPSGNTLRRGHRGRIEFKISWYGRSAHASAPQLGLNPHYSAARFLRALQDHPMVTDLLFGSSTVVPTLAYVDQTSSNVIPAVFTLHLDWRNVPSEQAEAARAQLGSLVDRTLEPGLTAQIHLAERGVSTYTGLDLDLPAVFPSFLTPEDHPVLQQACRVLGQALGRVVEPDIWRFATDGGQLAQAGCTCLGFGPGDERMAHVVDERLAVEELLEATLAYVALALDLAPEGPADTK